jgi:riboflavin synthase
VKGASAPPHFKSPTPCNKEKQKMFTGLVEAKCRVLSREPLGKQGARFVFESPFTWLSLGESIAVSGACLTVVSFDDQSFSVDASPETLRLTTLGELKEGDAVNLERALAAGARLGGHLVSGHVDGVGTIMSLKMLDEMCELSVTVPHELSRFIAKKGSLTVDGVSLTVNEIEGDVAQLLLIGHTRAVTTLGNLQVDSRVNIEIDLVARYVERLLSTRED